MTLNISQYDIENNVFNHVNIHEYDMLFLEGLYGDLDTFPCAASIKYVTIRNCPNVINLPRWPFIVDLLCYNCPNLKVIPDYPALKNVRISNCDSIENLPYWPQIENGHFDNCRNIRKIEHEYHFKHLQLVNMVNLETCNATTEKGFVGECPLLENVTCLDELTVGHSCPGILNQQFVVIAQTDFLIGDLARELFDWLK